MPLLHGKPAQQSARAWQVFPPPMQQWPPWHSPLSQQSELPEQGPCAGKQQIWLVHGSGLQQSELDTHAPEGSEHAQVLPLQEPLQQSEPLEQPPPVTTQQW